MQKLHRHGLRKTVAPGGEAIAVPLDLVLMLKAGASVPANWDVWSTADGKFLKGTTSDAVVNTTDVETDILYTSGAGGAHVGSTNNTKLYGNDSGGSGMATSRERDDRGEHDHTVDMTYTPTKCEFKMVKSTASSAFEAGLVGFATGALSKHTLYSLFNGSSGYLSAGTATQEAAHSAAATLLTADDTHRHRVSLNSAGLGVGTISNYVCQNKGGEHTHETSLTITPALARTLVRAYEILDTSDITGLIGIWLGTGTVPSGWALATELTDRFAQFSATATGEQSGDNTIDITGTVSTDAHSNHLASNGSEYQIYSPCPHDAEVTHDHSIANSISYNPDTYHVKFIRYEG